jgi:hypothetical protein
MIDAGRGKVACVPAVVTDRRVVGGHVRGMGGDRYGLGKVDLLPARSGLGSERSGSQQRPGIAPKVGHMRAGIGDALVEANAGDVASSVRIEPDA